MAFSIDTPARILKRELNDITRKTRIAGVRALNKTATQGRNIAQRQIRETINLKAAAIKKVLSIRRARNTDLRAAIRSTYQPVPVLNYSGVRQTKKGVSVRMRKDMPRMLFKHAFIANVGGHKGVFRRRGKPRLPIFELKGPVPQSIFIEHIDVILKKNDAVLERVYNHELDFIFGRLR